MAEYIEREAAKDELLSWAVCINHPQHLMREDAIHVLNAIPAADVAPVRYGRWIFDSGIDFCYKCSECQSKKPPHYVGANYCPNCGVKMNGERKENETV